MITENAFAYIYICHFSKIMLQIIHNKKMYQEFMTPNLSRMILSIQQDTQILQIKNYLSSHPFYKISSSENRHCVKCFRYDPKGLRRHHVYKSYHINDPCIPSSQKCLRSVSTQHFTCDLLIFAFKPKIK